MSRLSPLVALLLALLAAAAASAQAFAPGSRGAVVALGVSAPERLLFPAEADPSVTLGVRLSPAFEVHASLPRADIARSAAEGGLLYERTGRSRGALVAGAYSDRLGALAVRTGASLGYQLLRATQIEAPIGAGGELRSAREIRNEVLHVGFRIEAGSPISVGRVTAAPSLGLAGAVAARVEGDGGGAAPRALPFVRVPVRVGLPGVALTVEATAGVDIGRRADPFGRPTGATVDAVPVAAGGARIDF